MSRRTWRSHQFRRGLPAWAAERQAAYAAMRRAWALEHPPASVQLPLDPPGPLTIADLPE